MTLKNRSPYSANQLTDVSSDRLSGVQVAELMSANPVCVDAQTPVRDAAQLMHQNQISCLPVVNGKTLEGLLTEADFVARVVADNRQSHTAVCEVMTPEPFTVTPQQSILDVLTLMTRHRIAHMPVCSDNDKQLLGIVTQTDVIRHQIASSVFMVGDISRQNTRSDIKNAISDLPQLLVTLLANGHSAYETGRVMSSVTGAVTRRLLELAEGQFGSSPVPYVWLACGSQGRQEQTGVTDQDNCIIIDDAYDEDQHKAYFENLTYYVCDGLNECGYVYCPGDMMASNPRWRQPLSVWEQYFSQWIERPGNESQMLASVMFDLRPVAGEKSLYTPLFQSSLKMASSNSIFVAHMSTNCLAHPTPLGMFGRLKTHKEGTSIGKIDLKHDAMVPIVDLARLHAISSAIPAVNTMDRLQISGTNTTISDSGLARLRDAYETLSIMRLRHQATQISSRKAPDNLIDPAQLSSTEREGLKRSLKSIKDIQSAISNRVAVVGR